MAGVADMSAAVPSAGKLENVQALRGVAVLLVLFFHLHGLEDFYVEGVHLLPDLCSIGRCGVDLFFVISGVVMVVSTQGRFGRWEETRNFFLRRALRIYPLYWIYSIASLSVYLLPSGQVGGSWGQVDLLASFALWPQEVAPLLGVGWTLWHELYFYGIFALLLLDREEGVERWLGTWVVLLVAGGLAYWQWLTPPAISLLRIATDPMTLEFVAGCLIGKAVIRGGCHRWGWPSLLGGIALWGVAWWFYPEELSGSVPDRWLRVALLGVPAVLVLYGGVALEVGRKWMMPRWLVLTGYASYSIYLSHTLVLAVGRRMWFTVVERGYVGVDGWVDGIDNGVAIVLLVVLVLGVGRVSYNFVEKPILAMVRRQLRRGK
jgi:exopolysaccharide production protein ExoZ